MMMPPCPVHSAKSPWHHTFGERSRSRPAGIRAVGIVPEADRHRRERLGADELTLLRRTGCRRRPDVDRHAQARCPGFRRARRAAGIAEHEAGDDVGAAGDRGEVHVRLDRVVDVFEALGDSGEPVEAIGRRAPRSWVSPARRRALAARIDVLAETPKSVTVARRRNRRQRRRRDGTGKPS